MYLSFTRGERIKFFRKAIQMSKPIFAKCMGISERTQSDRETDKSGALHNELDKMVEMGANPEFLLTGKGAILREGFKRGS